MSIYDDCRVFHTKLMACCHWRMWTLWIVYCRKLYIRLWCKLMLDWWRLTSNIVQIHALHC